MKERFEIDLEPEQAKQVANKAFEAYQERFSKFNPQAEWVSDKKAKVSFGVKGKTLDGTLEIVPGAIEMELDVPMVFRVFKGKAMNVIREEIDKWAEKAKQGEI